MGKIVAAMATVHAPQLFTRPPTEDPAQLDADIAAMRELGKTLDETKPDVVIVIGSDHLETFFLSAVPTFAIIAGKTCQASFAGRDYELPTHPLAEELLDKLVDAGDEASLRAALELDASNLDAAVSLGDLLRRADRLDEADEVLKPFENALAAKTVLARIRLQRSGVSLDGDLDLTLEHLLEQSSSESSAKDSLLEILDALGPEDPRYVSYRRKLASRLY